MMIHARTCILVSLLLFASGSVMSLPRFASRTGSKCQSCHLNPTGAQLRQTLGVQYGKDQLPVPEWSKGFEMEDMSNLVANILGVGADFRTLYFVRKQGATNDNAFFEMQGDIYLDFHVARKIHMFINKGLRNGFEIFGLADVLPASGYVKIGKFLPDFGTRIDDHTTYIRTYTGFTPEFTPRPELTGMEAAISPGPFTVTGGVYNAADDIGAATQKQKAFLGRAEGMFELGEKTHLGLGANVFSRQTVLGYTTSLMGALGSFSYLNYTLFGEADIIKNNGNSGVDGFVSYAELDAMVVQGLDLKLAYDFYDPDKNLKTGSLSRYSFGFEFFPIGGVEVRPIYRIIKDGTTGHEFDLLVHFYF